MFKNNQILYMRFQCIDVYGCPKLLDMCSVMNTEQQPLMCLVRH